MIADETPLPDGTLVRKAFYQINYPPSARKVYSVSNWGYCIHLVHPPTDCFFANVNLALMTIGAEIIITDEKTIRRDYEIVEKP